MKAKRPFLVLAGVLLVMISACEVSSEKPVSGDDVNGMSDAGLPDADGALSMGEIVEGLVVDFERQPLSDMVVLCCDASICYMQITDDQGLYRFEGVEAGSWKMQVDDPQRRFTSVVFFQEVGASTDVQEPGREIVLTPATAALTMWPVEQGGTVALADGSLELEAVPDTIRYPSGLPREERESLRADAVAVDTLPPYDSEPWASRSGGFYAFFLNPIGIKSNAPVTIRVRASEPTGTSFRLFTLDDKTGGLLDRGTATVGEDGWLTSDVDAQVTELTSLFLF